MGMKRLTIMLVCAGIITEALALSGCSASGSGLPQGTAEHEVLTLTPVDPDKIMITLRGVDGVPVWEIRRNEKGN